MNRRRKRIVAIVAAAALAALGGGAAYGASQGGDPQEELLSKAAQRLNVTPEQLRSALEGAFGDQLDEAVRDGKLAQQQADRMKEALRDHGLPLFGGPGGPGGPHVHLAGPIGPALDAAADYLGLTRAELGRRLMNGRSLAEIASAEGKSVDGLEQAIVDAAEQELDEAVRDGDLTDAQRDALLRRLREHVDELVAGRGPGPHGGDRLRFRAPHGGPGRWGGPPGHRAFDERDGDLRPGAFEMPAPPPGAWS